MRTFEAVVLINLMILSIWPETTGRTAHNIWNGLVAGWEQVRP
jgi:hypothetical protein